MEKLIALVNIQYKGKLYIPGEEIPVYTPEMAEAWKRAGSVKALNEAIKESPEDSSGTKSGVNRPEMDERESKGKMVGENAGEDQLKEEPDIKDPPKEGKKKK